MLAPQNCIESNLLAPFEAAP